MNFKIILSILFIIGASYNLGRIGKPRDPIGNWEALLGAIVYSILVYGLWAWI